MGAQTLSGALQSAPQISILWKIVDAGERLAAAALLVVLLPLLALSAFLVAVLSRRSPWIAHRRVGQHGQSIWVMKLRTMWSSGASQPPKFQLLERFEAGTLPEPKTPADARVTSPFAAWCRKYSIDECPQFWHVVRGEMALIGPRPLTATEIEMHYGLDSVELLSRKPGITGLWQIKGRSRLTYPQRRRLDLFLIRRWSLGLYMKVLFDSIPRILTGRDAW
ncbi:MAG TPA: sugar transferase [Bryobacteraceae bacterium]|nr:sugar transferase [Bryobacteraceae bacterium]